MLFLIHEGYQLYAYTTMYYNPVLSKVTGYALTGAMALHVILSLMSVFILHDAKNVAYKKLNIKINLNARFQKHTNLYDENGNVKENIFE